MVCLLVLKGLLNKVVSIPDLCNLTYFYCDSLKYIGKTIENVNNIADNSLQKAF